ncbi:MAG TPA: TIGR03943 family protein [Actinomycetota bacterium]
MNDQRTQGALLLAVGATALFLSFSDLTLSYVRAGLRPLLGVAGAILLGLGLLSVLQGRRQAAGGEDEDWHDHDGGHGPRVAWLLVLPVLVLLLVEPPALGSFAALRQSSLTLAGGDGNFPPLARATGGAVPVGLSEFVDRALFDKQHSLAGQRVRVFGFVMPEKQGSYRLARFVMYCCAADAEVVEIVVRGDPTPRQPDQWVTVEGRWLAPGPGPGAAPNTVSDGHGGRLPVLAAETVTVTSPPRDRYEHSIYGV